LSIDQAFLPGRGLPRLVSIIIPCYNRADIVSETVDSVLAQKYERFEMIIIDDGSTDNTREVISSYSDSRIRYFYQANGGLSAARNAGLNAAKGEFIAFLDSDDLWHDWKLSAQLEIFRRHPEAGLIWSDMSTFVNSGRIDEERHLRTFYSAYKSVDFEAAHGRRGTLADLVGDISPGLATSPYYLADVFQYMFSGNLVHPSTAIVRRDRLRKAGPFQPEITGFGAEDYHFYFRICSEGPVAFLDAPTTLYRIHSSQMTNYNRLVEARANLRVITHWLSRRPPTLPRGIIQKSLASSHAWLGSEELNAGNLRAATRHFWESLRRHRTQPATFVLLLVSLIPHRAAGVLRALKRALLSPASRGLTGILILLSDDQSSLMRLLDLLPSDLVTGF
jgi:glycosyltransferase involved in cell wall biosynthesis